MSADKYPAELVEKVAIALHDHDWAEWSWDGAHEDVRVRFRARAIVALDALDLTVTEEWGAGNGVIETADSAEHARRWATTERMLGRKCHVEKRTVLHAETPWKVESS